MDDQMRTSPLTEKTGPAEAARVAQEVAQAIVASGRFRPGRVAVSNNRGIIRLRGRVASFYQKQVAQAAALTVVGPHQLVNDIEVG